MQRQLRSVETAFIPKDILFCIVFFLDINNLFLFKLVSKYYCHTLNALLKDNYFCQLYAVQSLHLKPEQVSDIQNYQDFFFARYAIKPILENELERNEYIQWQFKLFCFKFYYRCSSSQSFSIENIQNLLLEDNAQALFAKVSPFNDMIPIFKNKHVSNVNFFTALGQLETNNKIRLTYRDCFFVGLLPSIIRFRAINCFSLFLSAYLIFLKYYFNHFENLPRLRFAKICKLILTANDKLFINQFLSLTMEISNPAQPFIYDLIKLALQQHYAIELFEQFEKIESNKKLLIINKCIEKNDSSLKEFIKLFKDSSNKICFKS